MQFDQKECQLFHFLSPRFAFRQGCETRASPFFHWSLRADSRLSEINRGDELCELQNEGVGDGGKERGDRNVDSPPSLRSYWVELSETGAPGKLELARDTRRSLVSGDTCHAHDQQNPHLHTILEFSLTIAQTRKKNT